MREYKEKRNPIDDFNMVGQSNWKDRVDIYLNGEDCKGSRLEKWGK